MKPILSKKTVWCLVVFLCLSIHGYAGAQGQISDILERTFNEGNTYIDVRCRYEFVDQDDIAKDARASTIRTRLGYETGAHYDLRGFIEMENISIIGDTTYNSGTNGKTEYPIVADPDGTELNQAYLSYSGSSKTTIKFGRQKIVLDNARFVGDVGWRQNNQTYDSVALINNSFSDIRLYYGFVNNVNRIFGDNNPLSDFDTKTHLFNVTYSGLTNMKLTGYAYLMDIKNAPEMASRTSGLSLTGTIAPANDTPISYHLEYARQSDYKDNPEDYNADYTHIVFGISSANLAIKAGYESLGSDSGVAMQTPYATLHKFNGWADRFSPTPRNGLVDQYGLINYKVSGAHDRISDTNIVLVYHKFSSDEGDSDYGTEWDLLIEKKFMKNYHIGFKYANFGSDSSAIPDVEKVAILFGINLSS